PEVHGQTDLDPVGGLPAARMTLRPPAQGSWFRLPGAGLFRPATWHLSAFRGVWFKDAGAGVETSFSGRLPQSAIATQVPEEEMPVAWRVASLPRAADTGALDACIRAFEHHDWAALLQAGTGLAALERTPLAFLDPRGRIVPPE